MSLDINTLRTEINSLISKINSLESTVINNDQYVNALDFYDNFISTNEMLNNLSVDVADIAGTIFLDNKKISSNDISVDNKTLSFDKRLIYNNRPVKNNYDMALPEYKEYTNTTLEKGDYYILVNLGAYSIPVVINYCGKDFKNNLIEIKDNVIKSDKEFKVYKR
jgi:hypothetical protein|nr:MAG TPA: hypothetical protein [Caudoviricetes sp.]